MESGISRHGGGNSSIPLRCIAATVVGWLGRSGYDEMNNHEGENDDIRS